jgi:hypothetical protein
MDIDVLCSIVMANAVNSQPWNLFPPHWQKSDVPPAHPSNGDFVKKEIIFAEGIFY